MGPVGLEMGLEGPVCQKVGGGGPGSQASSRGEAKDSALLSSRDGHLLEPTLWPKGIYILTPLLAF